MGFVEGGKLGGGRLGDAMLDVEAPAGWMARGLAELALAEPGLAGPSSHGRKRLLALVGR